MESYVIEVIPIARGIFKEKLSYFSTEKPEIGSLLSIPLRNKFATGLVVGVESARERKGDLKREKFALKRIQKLKSSPFLSPAFLKAAQRTTTYYAGTLGSVLNTLLPSDITFKEIAPAGNVSTQTKPVEKLLLQGRILDRVSDYKAIVREHFARGESVFLLIPTVKEAEVLIEELSRGIGRYSYTLHGLLPKKEIRERARAILKDQHPVLIIATGNYLSLPRKDIGLYIVEKEQSRFYRSSIRPYMDVRRFTEYLAEESGAKLIYADTAIRVETAQRYFAKELEPISAVKFRLLGSAMTTLVDLREKADGNEISKKEKEWRVLSDELLDLLRNASSKHERSFVFTARRGLSPLVLCNDCETVVICGRCSAPIVLHGSGREPSFLCHRCGEKRSAEERCRKCGSWKLIGLGLGSETVARAIYAHLGNTLVSVLDRDHAPTEKKAREIVEKFYETPGSILLGTEMALFYLTRPIENTVAAAFDSLFAVPDFRMQERIFHLLLELRERATSRFLIQSRVEPGNLFEYVKNGNLGEFYKEDLALREKLEYPPFRVHIRLTLSGELTKITEEVKQLEKEFSSWKPLSFPALFKNTRGEYSIHLLLSLMPTEWPQVELLEKLRALPPRVRVEVDPESSA